MKKFLKLALQYWLYNQLFFAAGAVAALLAFIFLSFVQQPLQNVLSAPAGLYAASAMACLLYTGLLFLLYRLFKCYWRKLQGAYNPMQYAAAALLPLCLTAAAFTLAFYAAGASINTLGVLVPPLAVLHLSVLTYFLTLSSYFGIFAAIFAFANLIPLAFFARYVYVLRGVRLPLAKPAACALALLVCCGAAISHTLATGNVIRSHSFAYENGLSSVDLYQYKITNPNNILPKLSAPCTLQLTQQDWLTLDGAEAAYPVYSTYANACYAGVQKYQYDIETTPYEKRSLLDKEFRKYVAFNNTVYAFKDLINKRCDVFFGAMPSQQQQADAAALGEELVLTPIAQEAFIFFVSSDNPVESLTTQQIQDIYSGKTKNWQPLGGDDRRILAFQRPEGSGSQTLLQHIMGSTPIMQPLQTEYIGPMSGIRTAVAEYNGDAGALGFSFKFFLTGMLRRDNAPVKILAINGVAPTGENIRSGAYPFTTRLYAITLKSNSKPQLAAFLNWMQSPQGQELAEKVGYVRLDG